MNKYQERLLNEWKQYGKIIIATDFDSTISPWETLDNKEDMEKVITTLKLCKEVGCYLVVFTACNNERFSEINNHCKNIGLNIDSINRNPIDLPYGNNTKIYANVFIDDRSLSLMESVDMLTEVAYRMRAYNYSKLKLDEIG